MKNAFDFPGFVPAYIRPLFCEGSARSAGSALRRPGRHLQDRPEGKELIPDDPHLHNWLDMARERIAFQACRRGSAGSVSGSGAPGPGLQRDGEEWRAESPGRHRPRPPGLRLGGEPNRETESMMDGSDAVSDWPLLNALLNTAGGDLGLPAPRWRGRHGLHSTRRGDRL